MCRGHHRHGRRGHGFPAREEWVERLQARRDRLETELKNVEELIERLADRPAPPTETA